MNDNISKNSLKIFHETREKSPRKIGAEKELAALAWIYRFGKSTKKIVDEIHGNASRGLAARCVKKGLLIETNTVSGTPQTFLTLSRAGLEIATAQSEDLLNYQLDPYRTRQDHFRHDFYIQKTALKAVRNGHTFSTEKELAEKSSPGEKQFDLIIYINQNIKVGVEVELSAKWERDLDFFVRGCFLAIKQNRVDMIQIVSDSKAILKRYQKALAPGEIYTKWIKDKNNKWSAENTYSVGQEVDGKIHFELIEV